MQNIKPVSDLRNYTELEKFKEVQGIEAVISDKKADYLPNFLSEGILGRLR